MKPVAIDWDDTLVDVATKEWLAGAETAVRQLLTLGHRVIIHSCRANFAEGRAEIIAKLKQSHLDHPSVTVEGKPDACIYIDNLGYRFDGDWQKALAAVPGREPRKLKAVVGPPLRVVGPTARPTFASFPRPR